MKMFTTMTPEIFSSNLEKALSELHCSSSCARFRIIPEYDEHKSSNGKDDMFQMIALSDNNIKDRLLKFENVVEILSCMSPHVPTQIKVKVSELSSEQNIVFDLITSTRIRKPSELANIETGHPPFKVIR